MNAIQLLETNEVIQKLRDAGYSKYIDCLLENEKECYTKKSRINKSGTCRKLDIKNKTLEDAFREMRALIKKDFDLDD